MRKRERRERKAWIFTKKAIDLRPGLKEEPRLAREIILKNDPTDDVEGECFHFLSDIERLSPHSTLLPALKHGHGLSHHEQRQTTERFFVKSWL